MIALDNRGHGDSEKLYDSADYEIAIMASDVIALLDHLGIERADIMGYSLGSRMTAILAREQPQRLRSAILGGIGIGLIEGGGPGENVAISAGSAVAGGRHRSGRTDVSRLRRPDPLRPPRACRLPARFAAADDIGGGRRDRRAGPDRGRHQGRDRGLSRGARENHSGRRGARHSEPRSHARGRRQGLQDRRHRLPVAPAMSGRALRRR